MTATLIYGPVQARVRWEYDSEPLEMGDIPAEDWEPYVDAYGVMGCIVEARPPACPCCEREPDWQHVTSLWNIVGDDAYHREVERDLFAEV